MTDQQSVENDVLHYCRPPVRGVESEMYACPCGRHYVYLMDYSADHVACYWFLCDAQGLPIPPRLPETFVKKVARWLDRTDR